jgi:hypothetical protein
VKTVHKDLLEFETKTEQRFDRLEAKVDRLDQKIDSKIDGLTKALPGIVGDKMRAVLREHRDK